MQILALHLMIASDLQCSVYSNDERKNELFVYQQAIVNLRVLTVNLVQLFTHNGDNNKIMLRLRYFNSINPKIYKNEDYISIIIKL